MFSKQISQFRELPVPDQQRKCADVCCIFFAIIFSVTMFILSLCLFDSSVYSKTNYPTDSNYRTCGIDISGYPYVYFNNPADISGSRICLSSCPEANDTFLQCTPTKSITSCMSTGGANIYPTQIYDSRYGQFCMPTSPTARQGIHGFQENFMEYWDVSWISLLWALFFGIGFMLLVQCLPELMVPITWISSGVILLAIGILFLADAAPGWNNYHGWRIFMGVFLLLLSITIFILLLLYKHQFQLSVIYLKYSTIMLGTSPLILLYIPVFLILMFLLIVLCVWQYIAFAHNGTPTISPSDIYWQSNNKLIFLQVLTFIQFVWGLQFLRDSFNYLVSGNTIEWYFTHQKTHVTLPIVRYFKFNFGSVVAGSFMNFLFMIPEFIVGILKCEKQGNCGKLNAPCEFLCGCLFKLLDLVRTDSYAYINLTGSPYCNSSVDCATLCSQSKLFVGSQSCNSIYRACGHFTTVGLTFIIQYIIMRTLTNDASPVAMLMFLVGIFCVCTFFIGIHSDAATGLQISFLLEHELEFQQYDRMTKCYPNLRVEIEEAEKQFNKRQ